MNIKNMFEADINRHIDKVVKVDQNAEDRLYQEITEYVITKEIRRNFGDFFNAYEKSIDYPNDNIGVWISGFFGSGKSHFLKMLSYLLTNKEVKGKRISEYFKDKFDDPMMFSVVERCLKKNTDSIMFDVSYIGQTAGKKLDLVSVFAKVFYDYLGYYGTDLKVAKFEKFLDDQGKYDLFKENFKKINGSSWVESREAFAFFEDDIVKAYMDTVDCSESQARNWFNGEETSDLNIQKLGDELSKYVNSKGKDFRLLFMVDEMGMYVGDSNEMGSTDLLESLRAIVQEVGVKCNGKVWIMCTGQEALDSIIKVKGQDLSKILARFDIKLKLSSSSTDEVIKKRILAKTNAASETLKLQYASNAAILKNLFTFNRSVLDLKGYTNEENFVETYPFVSYQFIIEQKVLSKIRLSGYAGASLSTGERTMLAAFQLAAQDIQAKDENALVPFYYFYKIVEKDLDHQIRIVFERCQKAANNNDGIEQYDVEVLKLLFLIRNIEDFPHNIDNIATLMIDDIRTDKINLRIKITKSLERLLNQNYIARNGDSYDFLTDDEQDISREIRATIVDTAQTINSIGQIIFDDLYTSKKFRYGKYDFDFDKLVDDTQINTPTGGIKLRIITESSDLYAQGEGQWIFNTQINKEAYVVLNTENSYFDELVNAAKIKKYIKTRNVSQLPEAIQNIIRVKQQQANNYEKNAKSLIEKAIVNAVFVICGQRIDVKGSSVKEKIDNVLTYLVETVYTKLSYIKYNFTSDDEVLKILSPSGGFIKTITNEDAVEDIKNYLVLKQSTMINITMADIIKRYSQIPYGWKEIDIAACVVELIKSGDVSLEYLGNTVSTFDKNLINYLRRKSEVDKVIIKKRVSISQDLIKKVRNFLKDYLSEMDVPSKEDDLVLYAIDVFERKIKKCQELTSYYSIGKYPQRNVVEDSISLFNEIINRKKDNEAFLNIIDTKQDDLYDNKDDLDDIISFFDNQVTIYDKGANKVKSIYDEKAYFDSDSDALNALEAIKNIIDMERPYKRIIEIPNYIDIVDKEYNRLLLDKKDKVNNEISNIENELNKYKNEYNQSTYDSLVFDLNNRKNNVANANKLTMLDALISNLNSFKENAIKELIEKGQPEDSGKKVMVVNKSQILKSKNISKNNIDDYLEDIKKELLSLLNDNDEISII